MLIFIEEKTHETNFTKSLKIMVKILINNN